MKDIIYLSILVLINFFTLESEAQKIISDPAFRQDTNDIIMVKMDSLFHKSDSIILNFDESINGFAITGTVEQPDANSSIRILLKDKEGKEYVVLESNRLYNDAEKLIFSNYCEETKTLIDIHPSMLYVYLSHASIYLSQISFNLSENISPNKQESRISDLKNKSALERLEQAKSISNNINDYNKKHKKLWRAEPSDLTILPWENKKRVLGLRPENSSMGFEYYSTGIFEIGDSVAQYQSNSNSPYVDNFDWRWRHGKNWMTTVKNQLTGNSCWAFAAVGLTEAMVNIYFNRKIDYDLSEQEIISCCDGSNANGGSARAALNWIKVNGVSEESSFPFSNSDEPCNNKGYFNELISFNDTSTVKNFSINNNDSIKKALINNGPLTSGFVYNNGGEVSHSMVLTGYATLHQGDTIRYFSNYNQSPTYFDVIQNDDPRIGKTYWIFKNSYGTNRYYEHHGYVYVLFNDQSCFGTPCFIVPPISSLVYDDTDIEVADADGDGFFYWGIGEKPIHCPDWVPDIPDGDDSDYSKGPMDKYGCLYDFSDHISDTLLISSDTIWNGKRFIYNNIVVPSNVTLTISGEVVFYHGAKISLQGGVLHVNGGHLIEAEIDTSNSFGSNITISNGGIVDKTDSKTFSISPGMTFEMNYGTIN